MAVATHIAAITGAGSEMMQALEVCLRTLENTPWPEVAWGFSRLTTSRHPVEFGFSTGADALRVTLEVAGPEVPERLRLDAALNLLARLGIAAPASARIRVWRDIQAGASLRWGCWLGLRQIASGFAAKLYIEVPRNGEIPAPFACPGAEFRFLGHDLTSGATEYYFAWPPIGALECERRLAALGIAAAPALVGALEQVIGIPRTAAIGRARLGVSLADGEHGAALFVDSGSLFGRAAALHRLLAVPQTSYISLVGKQSSPALPAYGILTLIPRTAGVELRAGIAADALAMLSPGLAGRPITVQDQA